jgi:hypothetical protein
MTITYQGTANTLTVYVDGRPYHLQSGTIQYNQVKQALLDGRLDEVPTLLAPGGALQRYLGSEYVTDGTTISFRGAVLPEQLNARIFAMANEGLDPSPLLRFYERLDQNPSFRARTELFTFIKHLDIAIEPDGTFLGYKKVNDNYTDCHSGTFHNTPGTVHEMPRNQVNDDADQTCSYGFHVGALEYARDNFHAGRGNIMICRVDPKDVVSIPSDYDGQKLRTCKYEVVGEWNGQDQMSLVDSPDLDEGDVGLQDVFADGDRIDADDDLDEGDDFDDDLDADEDDDLNHPGIVDGMCANADCLVDHSKVEPPAQPIFEATPAPFLDTVRTTKALMECSIEDLRKYASGHLKIVGASKISGGKSALVAKIIRVRRNRGL